LISDRLKIVRKKLGLNQLEFAELLGIKQGSYSDIERNKSNLTETMALLLEYRLSVNLEWLKTGEGDMFRDEPINNKQGTNKEHKNIKHNTSIPTMTETPDADCNELDVYGDISAGEPTPVFDHEPIRTIPIGKSLLPDATKCTCFRVNGQSMEPDILHGDYVIIKQTDNLTNLDGKVIAVRDPNGITLKVLFRDPLKRKYLLMPINPQYKPIPLDADYHIIGYLKLVIRQYSD